MEFEQCTTMKLNALLPCASAPKSTPLSAPIAFASVGDSSLPLAPPQIEAADVFPQIRGGPHNYTTPANERRVF
jgi:hypothetical protein